MHEVFYYVFFLTALYRIFKQSKYSFLMHLLSRMLVSSEKDEKASLSVISRSASKSYLLKCKDSKENEYEIVLPLRRKPLVWDKCMATLANNEQKDVTKAVIYRAGPGKDFFGLSAQLKPHQIVTGSVKLQFFNGENVVLEIMT